MATVGFLAVSFMWASFSVHIVALTALSDFCRGVDQGLAEQSQYGEIFNILINCENSTQFRNLRTIVDDSFNLILYSGCATVQDSCSQKVPCYGSAVSDTANCTVGDCSGIDFSNCTDVTLRQISNAVQNDDLFAYT